jgi:2-phospho-L-lactate/phosphoenolpyruvate guanylyltransferase
MNLWLLIPVKPFVEGKSRLSPVLDADERAALSRQLLENVLTLAQASDLFAGVLVVSRDEGVLTAAERMGAVSLREPRPETIRAERLSGVPGRMLDTEPPHTGPAKTDSSGAEATLNRALEAARQKAIDAGAEAVLVLPADLPLATQDDLHALIAPARRHSSPARSDRGIEARPPAVVLAPSHDGGTNALLLRPPGAIPFAFGPQSFDRHRDLAQAAGCALTVVRTPSLTYDLDLPEDLWGEDLGV